MEATAMFTIDQLIAQIYAEAQREFFPIDEPVYRDASLDPKMPILQGVTIGSKGWQSLVFIHLSPQKNQLIDRSIENNF